MSFDITFTLGKIKSAPDPLKPTVPKNCAQFTKDVLELEILNQVIVPGLIIFPRVPPKFKTIDLPGADTHVLVLVNCKIISDALILGIKVFICVVVGRLP